MARIPTYFAWMLLCAIGIFGAHRFYVGRYLTGIIWLFTGGLLGLGIIWDICNHRRHIDEYNKENGWTQSTS